MHQYQKISTPWGHYAVLAEHQDYKLKYICVQSGHRLSLQRHKFRQEHWYVLNGEATVELSNLQSTFNEGGAIDIPVAAWHRLSNSGTSPLEIIEIQRGSYLGEDDIERKQDDYGRLG